MSFSKEEYELCLQGLESDDCDLRRESAEDLGYSGVDEAALELVKHLADQDKGVRDAVANSLKKLNYTPSSFPLTEYLRNQEIDIRNYASDILINMQAKALPALLEKLNDADHDVRKFSADILGLIKSTDSIPELTRHLDDFDPNVQVSAIEALGNLGYPEVSEALINKAKRDPEHMAMVLDALGKIGSDQVTGFIEEAITDEDSIIAFSAIETIGQIGKVTYLSLLFAQLNQREDFFSAPILLAILKITNREKITVTGLNEILSLSDGILETAFSENEVLEQLYLNLKSIETTEINLDFYKKFLRFLNKESKLILIGRISSNYNCKYDLLIRMLLKDIDSWIAFKACEIVAKFKIVSLSDVLLELADGEDAMLIIGTAQAFGELKLTAARPLLEKLRISSADKDIRNEISKALDKIMS